MAFGVEGTFTLDGADPTMYPVHAELLSFKSQLSIKVGQEHAKGVSAVLVVPSLARERLVLMTPDLHEHVDVDRPDRIIGREQPRWSVEPACLRTVAPLDVLPFTSKRLGFSGHAYVPYVPDYSNGAVINELLSTAEQAYERGSLRGHTVFGAALYVSDQDGLSDWYQLVGYYEPSGKYSVRTEVRNLSPVEPGQRPRVFWTAQPDFVGSDAE